MNDASLEHIARIAHEVNRFYCEAINDTTQLPWDQAPQWQKDSAIEGVKAHMSVDLTPKESHENWCQHKVLDGWSWGITKDVEAKKHPCLIPYDNLPHHQKVKDYLFSAVVFCFKKGGDSHGQE